MKAPAAWKGASIDEPVPLIGRHVRLEPLTLAHSPDLYRAGGAPEIWTHLVDPWGPFTSIADASRWVEHVLEEQTAGVRLPFAIVSAVTGAAIGSTGYFFEARWANRVLEIGGTWLSCEHWRTAANTECKLLLLGHAFERLGADRVELMTDARNVRSQRAIERLGARREGVLRAHMLLPDGHRRDSVYYSILADEWPPIKERLLRNQDALEEPLARGKLVVP
jgi:N-acetyltransferase